jgi:hypothetical protein
MMTLFKRDFDEFFSVLVALQQYAPDHPIPYFIGNAGSNQSTSLLKAHLESITISFEPTIDN